MSEMTTTPQAGPLSQSVPAKKPKTLKEMLGDVDVKKRFEEIMGRRAGAFMSNLLSVSQGNSTLQECVPGSIIASAMKAAALDLPIEPSLGMAAIVPYKDKDGVGVAQFQIMWRGFVQLALRTGKYTRINLARVYEGQLVRHNEFTGEVELDASKKKSDRVEGYFFFFTLNNGYRCEAYWSARRGMEHGKKFSKSFYSANGKWCEDPLIPKDKSGRAELEKFAGFLTEGSGSDAMCAKTVVKMTLSKWGLMSIEMQEAVKVDQARIKDDGTPEYIDATAERGGEDTPRKTYALPKELPPGGATPAPAAAGAAAKAEGETAQFQVSGAATTDFHGTDAYCIRDTSDPSPVKYYTDQEAHYKLAKAAEKSGDRLAAVYTLRESGKQKVRWLLALQVRTEAAA